MITKFFIRVVAVLVTSAICSTSVAGPDTRPAAKNDSGQNKAMLEFYRMQSPWTDPGRHKSMYDGMQDDIGSVVQSVQNVLMHGGLVWLYKLTPSDKQTGGQDIRRTDELVDRIAQLDSRPLNVPRPPTARLMVNCRQFAVLTCSILRQKGIPARARAGYALYTWGRGKYENHWICEYWHAKERRWIQVDAQIDDKQRHLMRIDFDTLDLPKGRFVAAGEGWLRCRSGSVPAESFGLGGKDGWSALGRDMLVGNVLAETMALNKEELLPWDVPPYWGTRQKADASAEDAQLLTTLSEYSMDVEAHWSQLRKLYSSREVLRMPENFDKGEGSPQ